MSPIIETEADLDRAVDLALRQDAVAIDTEFVWQDTYYPWLGLVQLMIEDECVLVDAVRVKDISALGRLLSDGNTVKVLHDAVQDLTILRRATGSFPRNVFDTQVAAGFAGLGSTQALSRLASKLLRVDLDKSQTRTDWIARPLSEKQVHYAADDVRYLLPMRDILIDRAEARGTRAYLDQELGALDQESRYHEPEPTVSYDRLKGLGRLNHSARAKVRRLIAVREGVARRLNKPRGHVLPDDLVVRIGANSPSSSSALLKTAGSFARTIRSDADSFLAALEDPPASRSSEDEKDRPRWSTRREESAAAVADLLYAYLRSRCQLVGIDVRLVGSRSSIRTLVHSWYDGDRNEHPVFESWRDDFIGQEVTRILEGTANLVVNFDSKGNDATILLHRADSEA